MSSRVLQHGNTKIWFFFKKVQNWILTCILTCAKELKSFKYVVPKSWNCSSSAKELKLFKFASTWTYMTTSGMHHHLFNGPHLVFVCFRVKCPVPNHRASRRPLGTLKHPVWDLEVLETCFMAKSRQKRVPQHYWKKSGQINDTKKKLELVKSNKLF